MFLLLLLLAIGRVESANRVTGQMIPGRVGSGRVGSGRVMGQLLGPASSSALFCFRNKYFRSYLNYFLEPIS